MEGYQQLWSVLFKAKDLLQTFNVKSFDTYKLFSKGEYDGYPNLFISAESSNEIYNYLKYFDLIGNTTVERIQDIIEKQGIKPGERIKLFLVITESGTL